MALVMSEVFIIMITIVIEVIAVIAAVFIYSSLFLHKR